MRVRLTSQQHELRSDHTGVDNPERAALTTSLRLLAPERLPPRSRFVWGSPFPIEIDLYLGRPNGGGLCHHKSLCFLG